MTIVGHKAEISMTKFKRRTCPGFALVNAMKQALLAHQHQTTPVYNQPIKLQIFDLFHQIFIRATEGQPLACAPSLPGVAAGLEKGLPPVTYLGVGEGISDLVAGGRVVAIDGYDRVKRVRRDQGVSRRWILHPGETAILTMKLDQVKVDIIVTLE